MSRVLLFGANSMLGWSIFTAGGLEHVTPFCNGRTRPMPPGIARGLHLNDESAVRALFEREHPELIIYCAGVCNVANCEQSPEFAHSVNVGGARNVLAHAPAETRIVYCSSDHVFSGDGGPYDEESPTDPVSVYGRTRVAAEALMLARANTLVVRTGLWIGPSATGRIGHLDWLRYRHRMGLPMTLVEDEARSAVWASDAARRVVALADSEHTGLRHLTATRTISRPELARFLSRYFDIGAEFALQRRRDRPAPHIGNVELATLFSDRLAAPLPSVLDSE
ncbi:MAG TPA: sugar nucleotide-binding protein [Kofleriaceae bacterium]|nr:sugar nucleotide-binding protein [Kofleriaceae bacterium]